MAKTSKTVPQKEKASSSSYRPADDKAPVIHEIIPSPCVTTNDFKVENPPAIPGQCEHVSRYICSTTEKHIEAMKRDCGWGDEIMEQIPAPEESIGDFSEMRLAPPREETRSPIMKSGKNNKSKRVSKPEDPQDKKALSRRRGRNLIHVDIESVHQLNDEEEDEGEDSALVVRTRKPVEAAKPSEPKTLPRDEEASKKDADKTPESPEVEIAPRPSTSTPEGAFTKVRADLSQCEAELQKTSDERNALKLPCSQKEEELRDLRADLAKARKDEAELDKQVTAILKEEVDQIKADYDRWKENMDRLAAENEASSAKLTSSEAQLWGSKEKNSAQAREIDELEVKLAAAKAEVGKTKVAADRTIVVYVADAEAAQTQLREAADQEQQSNNLAKCQSRRETLKGIHARGYDFSEKIAQAKALDADARFLVSSDDADDDDEGSQGGSDNDEGPEGEDAPEGETIPGHS
ncbi:PREDICTED: calpastatin-like [Nicotiana attenuata]|uniref:calpastatin-like n=1 Tax=Nicotiana attenuata TaxID=49451 RepID=UPI0009059314|nr:PREDICTED: calpastatin-like [Nicotiana attenuata]